jgi:hypothetical protein
MNIPYNYTNVTQRGRAATKLAFYTVALGFPRGGFDTAQERWKEFVSFPAYSTTGLTLPNNAKSAH